MKSRLTVNKACKNELFVTSILLIFISLIGITNQDNVIRGQMANEKGYELQTMGEVRMQFLQQATIVCL